MDSTTITNRHDIPKITTKNYAQPGVRVTMQVKCPHNGDLMGLKTCERNMRQNVFKCRGCQEAS